MKAAVLLGGLWWGLGFASPADATTLLPADLAAGRTSLEIGLGHVALDHAFSPTISAGLVGWYYPRGYQEGALRVSYRLYHADHVDLGGMLSTGISSLFTDPFELGINGYWDPRCWVQPALDLSLSLFPPGSSDNIRLRATLGPLFTVYALDSTPYASEQLLPGLNNPYLLPNVELAFQFASCFELGIGYPDILGLRGTW